MRKNECHTVFDVTVIHTVLEGGSRNRDAFCNYRVAVLVTCSFCHIHEIDLTNHITVNACLYSYVFLCISDTKTQRDFRRVRG